MRRKWIAAGMTLALLTGWGWVAIQRSHDKNAQAGNAGAGHEKPREIRERRESREDRLRRAQAWFVKLTAERPDLQIHYRDVPDEKNALLQLQLFLETVDSLPKEPDEVWEGLTDRGVWDAHAAAAWIEGSKDLLDRMEEIGLLPDQSCRGVKMSEFDTWKLRNLGILGRMLSVRARLAADSGDGAAAGRTLQAMQGISRALGANEAPSMLTSVLAAGLHQQVKGLAIRMTEAAATEEEAGQWLELTRNSTPPDRSAMIRGDWNASAASTLLPMLLGEGVPTFMNGKKVSEQGGLHLQDPDAAAAMWADLAAAQVREAQSMTDEEFLARPQDLNEDAAAMETLKGGEPEFVELLEGSEKFKNRLVRSIVMNRSEIALERAAAEAAWGKEPGPEPMTGKPFRVDAGTATVSMPEAEIFSDQKPVLIQRNAGADDPRVESPEGSGQPPPKD